MDKLNFDINQFLRFLLAGGWGLACFLFINPNYFQKLLDSSSSLDLILVALVIGSIIYIVHRALIYPNIYKIICIILCVFRVIKKWDWGFLLPFFPSQSEIKEDHRRWSDRKKENSFGKNIVEWASQVHFLYCSALASLFTVVVSSKLGNDYDVTRLHYVQTVFGILALAGFVSNLRLVIYDLKLPAPTSEDNTGNSLSR
jgi:hypothetical protein